MSVLYTQSHVHCHTTALSDTHTHTQWQPHTRCIVLRDIIGHIDRVCAGMLVENKWGKAHTHRSCATSVTGWSQSFFHPDTSCYFFPPSS